MSYKEDSTYCSAQNSVLSWQMNIFYQNILKKQISIFAKADALKVYAKLLNPWRIIR